MKSIEEKRPVKLREVRIRFMLHQILHANPFRLFVFALIFVSAYTLRSAAQPQGVPIVPSEAELNAPFGSHDRVLFQDPPGVYHPETWFHYIGGNVAKPGITADLEAIAEAGISGIHLFHGQFGGAWPGVAPQIACLSESWDDAVCFTAKECRRLGLRFTMQNCPGWAMSGGPWIEPSNAMRSLVWSRMDVKAGPIHTLLPMPQPSKEHWRDYQDITVLAFPTPLGDSGKALEPNAVESDIPLPWKSFFAGKTKDPLKLAPATKENPHWLEITFSGPVVLRTIEFPDVQSFSHAWCYVPGVDVRAYAVFPDGSRQRILDTPMPQSAWQSNQPISLACDETEGVQTYRIEIVNQHDMDLRYLRLFSAARKNNWESEAAWSLRSIVRSSEHPKQSKEAFIQPEDILDISACMDGEGNLEWRVPEGEWTILRVGHVNAGRKNGPAPAEGTGWECDKLSERGPEAHFAGFIGRLNKNPLSGGLLAGMLLDSWECSTQTWTKDMESEFREHTGYELRSWLPAVFGYVIRDQETTSRFLRDWRGTIGDLFANRFYGGMAKLAKENGLDITYETAAGDVFPADIMEYYKHADVPMCEFWHPHADSFVGSLNFKPIKPAASAARLYGKPRVSAEAFTSFELTWDEHLSMLKEVANVNFIEGATHLVFHTYTHNPRTDWLPPGTSFGTNIGTPFLRGQTWWKHMPEFTSYLSRVNYLLERGRPVSDVLWYLGDEIDHKPDQNAPFPEGFKYDYCNPDVLLHRLSVRNGKLVTPEGLSYQILWLPDNERMLPDTLERILSLVREGAVVVGNAPKAIATLKGGEVAQQHFQATVRELWGDNEEHIRMIGKGKVMSGIAIGDALAKLHLTPDVIGGSALWLHRRVEDADWYYVCAPYGSGFQGILSFNNNGTPEIWNPVSGEIEPAEVVGNEEGRTTIRFNLTRAGSCFVVFRETDAGNSVQARIADETAEKRILSGPWTLSFPADWGAPASIETAELKAWKDLDVSDEAKSFSGTLTYTTAFDIEELEEKVAYSLDLGRVEMIAVVTLNGKAFRTLWTPPYTLDITDALKPGRNDLRIEVTSTWFNRLVYDANQSEAQRKTWVIGGPAKEEVLRESGLIGPVHIVVAQ